MVFLRAHIIPSSEIWAPAALLFVCSVWDVASGKEFQSYTKHSGFVFPSLSALTERPLQPGQSAASSICGMWLRQKEFDS